MWIACVVLSCVWWSCVTLCCAVLCLVELLFVVFCDELCLTLVLELLKALE